MQERPVYNHMGYTQDSNLTNSKPNLNANLNRCHLCRHSIQLLRMRSWPSFEPRPQSHVLSTRFPLGCWNACLPISFQSFAVSVISPCNPVFSHLYLSTLVFNLVWKNMSRSGSRHIRLLFISSLSYLILSYYLYLIFPTFLNWSSVLWSGVSEATCLITLCFQYNSLATVDFIQQRLPYYLFTTTWLVLLTVTTSLCWYCWI